MYFGRLGEVNQLQALVVSNPAVLLYSASGAGKTSLINAGLLPRLDELGFEVFAPARLRQSAQDPVESGAANVFAFGIISSWADTAPRPATTQISAPPTANQPPAMPTPPPPVQGSPQREAAASSSRLAQTTITEYLADRRHLVDADNFVKPRVVVLDQFEELFTLFGEHWPQREPFFEQLRDALKKDELLRVLISMREEFVAQLDRYSPVLPGGLRTRFRLEALDRGAALDAVSRPLGQTRRSFAPGVAEELVDDLLQYKVETVQGGIASVRGEFVDPVQLQVVCRTLWLNLPAEVSEITEQHLRKYGSVDQALSKFYEDAVKAAAEKTSIGEARIRTWFEQAFITSVGTRNMVYETPLETAGMPNAVIAEFDSRHLVRAERRAATRWWELTHDRFIEPVRRSNRSFELQLTDKKADLGAIDANRSLAAAAQALENARLDDALSAVTRALGMYRDLKDRAGEAAALAQRSDIHLARADVHEAATSAQEALGIYVELADLPGQAAINVKLAEISSHEGDLNGAEQHYELAAKLFGSLNDPSGQADSYWGMAMARREHGLTGEALGLFDAARLKYLEADDEGRAADAMIQSGVIRYEQGDYSSAEASFASARDGYGKVLGESHSATLGAQNFLALSQWAQGNLTGAANLLEVVLRGQSETLGVDNLETIDTMLNLAAIRLSVGDAGGSIGLLQQALTSSEHLHETERMVSAHVALAAAYQTDGDFESALRHGIEAVRLNPGDWRGHYACGLAHWYEGRLEDAVREFSNSLEIQPSDVSSRSARGQCFADLGRFEEAIQDLDQVIEHSDDADDLSYARRGRAVAYAGLGKIDLALAELDQCVKSAPSNAWAYLSRAEVLIKTGRTAEAVTDLRHALEVTGPPLSPFLERKAKSYLERYGSPMPA